MERPRRLGVVYLNASPGVARAQVRHKLEPRGIRPEDLAPGRGPVLVSTEVPRSRYVDAATDRGLVSPLRGQSAKPFADWYWSEDE
jgi:hypothetical protein